MSVFKVPPGETKAIEYRLLNTIICRLNDRNEMNCEILDLPSKKFENVYLVGGDFVVMRGGPSKVYVKPKKPDNCVLTVYERKEPDAPLGKDIHVVCGVET